MDKFVLKLDWVAYEDDLYTEMFKAASKIRNEVINRMKSNLMSISFKDNTVRMAGGQVTSDLKRRNSVLNALDGDIQTVGRNQIAISFTALSKYYRDAHIGIYYEHGTGEKWDGEYEGVAGARVEGAYRSKRQVSRGISKGSPYIASSQRHYARRGKQIVTRSREINYNGLGKGVWVDLGGNRRITRSPLAGERNAGFVDYVGEDIKAHYWYRNAIKGYQRQMVKEVEKAFKKVRLDKYLKCSYSGKTLVLGDHKR